MFGLAMLGAAPTSAAPTPAAQVAGAVCGVAPADGTAPAERAKLVLDLVNNVPVSGEIQSIAFADDRSPRVLGLDYHAEDCTFTAQDIGRSIGITPIPARDANGISMGISVEATGEITNESRVSVNFQAKPGDESIPGTYVSGFIIDDPQIVYNPQPITLSASYEPQWLVIIMVFLPVLILGTLIIWIKGRAAGANQTYGRWLRVPGNLVAIGTGLVALVTYMQTTVLSVPDYGRYLNDSDWWLWTVNIEFWGLLAGACGIFTAAVLAVSVAGDVARGGTDPESKDLPTTSAGVFTAIGKGGGVPAANPATTNAGGEGRISTRVRKFFPPRSKQQGEPEPGRTEPSEQLSTNGGSR